jgi:acyl dehydratase
MATHLASRDPRENTMSTIFASPDELLGAVGKQLGTSEWMTISQDRVNGFADATDDHQWIHVDPERAKAGPFGGPIAHGYLTLSLVKRFLPAIVQVHGISMGVNYGAERIRFPAPVKVGARIRGSAELVEAEQTKDGGVQAKIRVTVEIEGGDRPGCVVDTISRYYPKR